MTTAPARAWAPGLGLMLALLALLAPARAADPAWQALREAGVVAVMRHAVAPGTGDPADFELDDCATQRNLDAAGRAQARAIGAAFRAHAVAVDKVLTSQWCRCRETAELLDLAPVEEFPPLNSFFADRSAAAAQTRRTRAYLAGLPATEMVVLVTHQVNITALTGVHPASGEVVAVAAGADGAVEVRARVVVAPE